MNYTFGPIPSRRLGRSLGINNIPPKYCTYSCVYCQLGNTIRMTADRKKFYEPHEIYEEAKARVENLKEKSEKLDYITIVPDGEPTLDASIGELIIYLKSLDVKVAVITNSSLIWDDSLKQELLNADWISFKVDSGEKDVWQQVDRPHGKLKLDSITNGLLEFSSIFKNDLVTETMLVDRLNDSESSIKKVSEFIKILNPVQSYILVPTRPPAESWVKPSRHENLNSAFQIFDAAGIPTELVTGYEGNKFSDTGDAEKDILNITAVHPLREEAVDEILRNDNSDWSLIDRLLLDEEIVQTSYDGYKYYLRNLRKGLEQL